MIVARRRRFLPNPDFGESTFLGDLLRRETVGGSVALVAALVAVVWANLDDGSYQSLRAFRLGPLDVEDWAADGALSIFFFVAGLELKREFLVGSLRRPADAVVPVVAACCGVAVPALVFLVFNLGTPGARGWAVPAATDIAFALAILSVVGSWLPSQLRAFLLTLAVVDDLIVIVIIAVFYSSSLHLEGLGIALLAFGMYTILQWLRVKGAIVYLPLAALAWYGVHHSGVHATIAGVVLGLLTRVIPDDDEVRSPAERLEHLLTPISAAVAVPFFALLSAGVAFRGGAALFGEPVVLGVVAGLVLGKPIGILGGTWLVTRLTGAELNSEVEWRDLIGVAILAGVGFTVSLLVSDLAFTGAEREHSKAAVLIASLLAGLIGSGVLRRRNARHRAAHAE